MYTYIEVRDNLTDEIVKRIDVTGKSDVTIQRTMSGMRINLNTDDYYICLNHYSHKQP